MKLLDERAFTNSLNEMNKKEFLQLVERYEHSTSQTMKAQGYKRINQKERTVVFSFGEMTFSRSRWKKGSSVRIPVDEQLGLKPRARYSQEFLYRLAYLSTIMPYRKVVQVVELLNHIYISKNIVHQAVKIAGQLLQDQEEYDSLAVEPCRDEKNKIKSDIIYIEGDGVWIKQKENKSIELSHFIVHTGVANGSRNVLNDKFEIISSNYHNAKDRLLDVITQHFEITSDTVVITNSDGGKGYSPYVFNELVSAFRPKAHFHFWDSYHVNQLIKKQLAPFPVEFTKQAFQTLRERNKRHLRAVLDTAESLIESDEKVSAFKRFSRQMLNNFQYTVKPEEKGVSSQGIGVMESQHRKITYRMKNRGMYWSKQGIEAMSQMILLSYTNQLRELFFGEWRKGFETVKRQSQPNQKYKFFVQIKHNAIFPPIVSTPLICK